MIELSSEETRLLETPLSRKDIALKLLRNSIVDGRLRAGQKLDQNELADAFGFSRMPVRDALKELETEGLVKVYPYRGVEVARLDTGDIRELFAIRGALERLALRRAAERLGPGELGVMRDCVERMDACLAASPDAGGWSTLNATFHATINRASGWPRLVERIDALRGNVERYVRIYVSIRGLEQSQAEHREVLDALERGDAARAETVIETHSTNTAEYLVAEIERHGPPA